MEMMMVKRILFIALLGLVVAAAIWADNTFKKEYTRYVWVDSTGYAAAGDSGADGSPDLKFTDTIFLGNTMGRGDGTALYGKFVIGAWADTIDSIGDADSVIVWLYGSFSDYPFVLIDSTTQWGLPCTLGVAISTNDSIKVDTLLKERLALVYKLHDDWADTVGVATTITVEAEYITR